MQERISKMSGVSKRLFMALSDFRGDPPQLEDALFQLASVVDSTSKHHYPGMGVTKRFVAYLDSVATQLFLISTGGRLTLVDCTFIDAAGAERSFGEILYNIRCSSYHDPEEVDALIHWGAENQLGVHEGRFIVNQSLLMALFLVLLTDEANKDRVDRDLFTDEHFLHWGDQRHPFHGFIGDRESLLQVLGPKYRPPT